MKKIIYMLPVIVPVFMVQGCLKERDRDTEVQAKIEQTVEDRLVNYRKVRMERCRESIMEEATRVTDSLMIVEARMDKDLMDRPPIPPKPERPEILELQDTTPIKPLLANEDSLSAVDTIQ